MRKLHERYHCCRRVQWAQTETFQGGKKVTEWGRYQTAGDFRAKGCNFFHLRLVVGQLFFGTRLSWQVAHETLPNQAFNAIEHSLKF